MIHNLLHGERLTTLDRVKCCSYSLAVTVWLCSSVPVHRQLTRVPPCAPLERLYATRPCPRRVFRANRIDETILLSLLSSPGPFASWLFLCDFRKEKRRDSRVSSLSGNAEVGAGEDTWERGVWPSWWSPRGFSSEGSVRAWPRARKISELLLRKAT